MQIKEEVASASMHAPCDLDTDLVRVMRSVLGTPSAIVKEDVGVGGERGEM